MIYGIGHDILELERVAHLLNGSSGERFLQRILTAGEREALAQREARRTEWVAGRFAAKEAVVKAFGTGIGPMIGFRDIEVLSDSSGKPHACLSEAAWNRIGLSGSSCHIHVSISHQPSLASAQAIVERLPEQGH
ncbi:holo-ACP synthase [Paenibacillus popilliae]|uniref:Holo-[acyl-carrier-protein] synthase n=1 Tax=Paenibacillus popilliae ATCC 14706 TaxID=1212764 RepID=M9M4L3_PAEPP|nr:holo-ACP synthase [Paenibacillus popilliae]GAC42218.1 phosphopantetheinyl transferase [Paenibacillus popilliae ATCC 14706]